jgi:hypothetical protein
MDATIAAIDGLPVTFDRGCRQADCPLNHLELACGGEPGNTTVHVQRPEIFTTLSPDDSGKENIQTKERSATRNFRGIDCVIVWHRDQGNDIPYLTIKSVTDIVQNSRKWRSSENRLKNLLLRFQQILNSVFGIARRHSPGGEGTDFAPASKFLSLAP